MEMGFFGEGKIHSHVAFSFYSYVSALRNDVPLVN